MNVLENGYIEIVETMGDDRAIVNAARKSFTGYRGIVEEHMDWDPEKDSSLLKYLWDNQHTSPFEMVEFKFAVKAPLFVVRQWQRHRTWSYNEISRRYTSKDIDFYIPEVWRKQSKDNKQASEGFLDDGPNEFIRQALQEHTDDCLEYYGAMINEGVCREQARMVLPQNMMVEFVAKVDLSNLIKFLKLRDHPHAQWEIQEYARAIEKLIEPIVPETMKLYRGK